MWTAQTGAVVGGRPASEPYPWTASLQLGREHYCGATLVRPEWALTATDAAGRTVRACARMRLAR